MLFIKNPSACIFFLIQNLCSHASKYLFLFKYELAQVSKSELKTQPCDSCQHQMTSYFCPWIWFSVTFPEPCMSFACLSQWAAIWQASFALVPSIGSQLRRFPEFNIPIIIIWRQWQANNHRGSWSLLSVASKNTLWISVVWLPSTEDRTHRTLTELSTFAAFLSAVSSKHHKEMRLKHMLQKMCKCCVVFVLIRFLTKLCYVSKEKWHCWW